MGEEQKTEVIGIEALPQRVKAMKDAGYRLVQIGATTTAAGYELNYSFDKGYAFANLRIVVPPEGTAVPSVSPVYWNAFLYENEIHDLFGIRIDGMVVDYRGKFYRTAVKAPFGETK